MTVYAMPLTNTAGWLGRRAGEMPSAAAVDVSISATCWVVSFSYVLSGEPATIDSPMARTAPGEAASRLTVWEEAADSASEPVKLVPSGRRTGHQTPAEATPLMWSAIARSEEHTSELQSQFHLVCRLLLEKKKKKKQKYNTP